MATNITPQQAVQDARYMIGRLQDEFGMDEDAAKAHIAVQIANAAEEKGADPQTVFNNFPQELRDTITYTPKELETNQNFTKWGIILAPLLLLGGTSLFLWGGARAAVAAGPWIARAVGLVGKPKTALEVTNYLTLAAEAAFSKGGRIIIMGVLAKEVAQYVNTAVNNWNDVFHWGKQFQQQEVNTLNQMERALGNAIKTNLGPRPVEPTLTKTKTAKPKVFIGTIIGGRVADVPDFVRSVDDKIVDEDDLMTDAGINMVRWVKALPDMLSYEIQVKLNPYDADQVRLTGHWVMLAMYLTTKIGKRMFIDEIVLGPIDPIQYWPETIRTESLRVAVNESMFPADLKPSLSPDGNLQTVDAEGNVISVFGDAKASERAKDMQDPVKAALYARIDQLNAEKSQLEIEKLRGSGVLAPVAPPAPSVSGTAGGQGGGTTYTAPAPQPVTTPVIIPSTQPFFQPLPQFGTTSGQSSTPQYSQNINAGTAAQPLTPQQAVSQALRTESSTGSATGGSLPSDTTHRVNTGGGNLNVRNAPGLNQQVQDKLPDGTRVKLSDGAGVTADGYFWVRVLYQARGTQQVGWVANAFLV